MIPPIGFIKIWRKIASKVIWKTSTPKQKVILITLLMMADFNPNEWYWKGQKYKTKPGQFVTSLESIREEAGKEINIQNVRSSLNKFEKLGFLTNESTKTGRLITIVKWGDYQPKDATGNNVTNKELTKSQQSSNKAITPKEEGKEGKEAGYRPAQEGLKSDFEEYSIEQVETEMKRQAAERNIRLFDSWDSAHKFWKHPKGGNGGHFRNIEAATRAWLDNLSPGSYIEVSEFPSPEFEFKKPLPNKEEIFYPDEINIWSYRKSVIKLIKNKLIYDYRLSRTQRESLNKVQITVKEDIRYKDSVKDAFDKGYLTLIKKELTDEDIDGYIKRKDG